MLRILVNVTTVSQSLETQREGLKFSVGLNRYRVMIDFLRDGRACPVLCKTLSLRSRLGLSGRQTEA